MKKAKDKLISVKEAAKMLGISKHTLYTRVAPSARNPFPVRPRRVGRSVLFSVEKLQKFIQGR
jgi:predicted DNA-binding transcriptional regulator AlpA